MATTQYIGSRYVPVFADPIEWSGENTYEPLTIVIHEGNSYTSKQAVPKGIDIANDSFWALTGNYDAQVELYRRETAAAQAAADDALEKNTATMAMLPSTDFSADNTVKDYVDAQDASVKSYVDTQDASVKDYADAQKAAIDAIIPSTAFSADSTVKDYIDHRYFIVTNAMSQEEINAALQDNRYVMFQSGTYNVEIITPEDTDRGYGYLIPSNTTVFFNHVTIELATSINDRYYILSVNNVENVKLFGQCRIVGDLDTHDTSSDYTFGHAIGIVSSKNVQVDGFYLTRCFGDGMYIGRVNETQPSDIHVTNVFCDNNGRNGLSITSGVNVYVDNCEFDNQRTSAPYCGIDIEPNNENDALVNIHIHNIVCNNNLRDGFKVYLDPEAILSQSASIIIEDFYVRGFIGLDVSPLNTVGGNIVYKNGTIFKTQRAILIRHEGSIRTVMSDINISVSGSYSNDADASLVYINGARIRRCRLFNIKTFGNGTVYSLVHMKALENASEQNNSEYIFFDITAPDCGEAVQSNIFTSQYAPLINGNTYIGAVSTVYLDGLHPRLRSSGNVTIAKPFFGKEMLFYNTGSNDATLTSPFDNLRFVQNGTTSESITVPSHTAVKFVHMPSAGLVVL